MIPSSIKLHPTIKALSKHIVYTHLHIGLSAALITIGTAYHTTITDYLLYGFASFFATISVYNFHGIYKAQQLNSSTKHKWIRKHHTYIKWLIAVSASIALLLIIYLLKKPFIVLPLLFIIGLISFFYVIPFKGSPLREQPFMKVFYVAVTWTIFLLIFPVLNEGITALHWGEICAFFSLFVAIALPYDVRDVSIDQQKFKTIPSSFGSKKTMLISVAAYLISGTLILTTVRTAIHNPFFWIVYIWTVLLLLSAFFHKKEPYYVLLDSTFGMFGLFYFW